MVDTFEIGKYFFAQGKFSCTMNLVNIYKKKKKLKKGGGVLFEKNFLLS